MSVVTCEKAGYSALGSLILMPDDQGQCGIVTFAADGMYVIIWTQL